MKSYLESIEQRRTIYNIESNTVMDDESLSELVRKVAKNVPSPYNMQSQRVVLLLNDQHKKLWNIVLETLRKIVPVDKFSVTENKISSFAKGYGTILYFEDIDKVESIAKEMPTYAENFRLWASQANGMMQYAMWTALEAEGFGASLQHYNPIIDEEVIQSWKLPSNWKLIAQMPFGTIGTTPVERVDIPIDQKVMIYK